MGAWDIGPFDNDTAADFANDLDDAAEHERIPLMRRALDAVIACDAYLDSDFGVEALAAAAIVARDLPGGQEFTSDAYGPDEPIPPIPADLYPLAVRAIDRILVTTSRPDGVESVQRQSEFRVTVDKLAWSIGDDARPLSGRLEPEMLGGARLLGTIAAWHVHDGTRSPSPVDVWLVLDPVGPIRVSVASDWRLSVERQGGYEPHDIQEYGRIEVDVPGADFALSGHVGNRILAVEAEYDTTTGQLMGMTLSFETGAVRLHSYGGDLLLGVATP